MFILDKNSKYLLRVFIIYIGIAAFIALFGGIYEQFIHGVMSAHMIYAYHWVIGFGVLMYLLLWLLPSKKMPGVIVECIYNTGVALLTTRSIFLGVLEIYGKTNSRMLLVYTVFFHLFLIPGLIGVIISLIIGVYQFIKEFIKEKKAN